MRECVVLFGVPRDAARSRHALELPFELSASVHFSGSKFILTGLCQNPIVTFPSSLCHKLMSLDS